MKVLVSGSTGLVGTALVDSLVAENRDVIRLVRRPAQDECNEIQWDPNAGIIDSNAVEGLDAVVHLAGENITSGRWTTEHKGRISSSRVQGTQFLSEVLAQLEKPPRVLACASAIGFYGDREKEMLDEESEAGTGFLADVCQAWEGACKPAAAAGVRVVHLRFGIILSRNGGALAKMLAPFKMGIGGQLGDGKQYMSWVTLHDAVRAICFSLAEESLEGPVNVVGPNPATNYEFTKTLGGILRRPTLFTMPGLVARIAFGEMADALLLSSARVDPKRLLDEGLEFQHPDLGTALEFVLGLQG